MPRYELPPTPHTSLIVAMSKPMGKKEIVAAAQFPPMSV